MYKILSTLASGFSALLHRHKRASLTSTLPKKKNGLRC
ncbi:hypothetical protein ACP70R_020202 [Stipagrostis hirtigluma subsp. patula]